MSKKYVGDFETATWLDDETYVWAYAICEIGNIDNIIIGNNINDFMDFCRKEKNPIIYFHNLKFDGEFILSYLFKNNFKWIKDKKERCNNSFITLISDMGLFYQIEVYFSVGNKQVNKVTFIDSLKLLPFSVEDLASTFNLEFRKLELDYDKPREIGHILDPDEEEYIKNDVRIVAKGLELMFKNNMTRLTIGSNALNNFKDIITENRFKYLFPKLDYNLDKDLRASYKGGFTYLNPIYKDKDIGVGITLDVNSLYPSVMYNRPLPFGDPIFFEGKYIEDKVYNLYIQRITCSFELKENMIPTIQIKKSIFKDNEYLRSSDNEIVALTLTNVDLKLFLEHYNVYDLEYLGGWKFKSLTGIFTNYIDYWMQVKIESTINKNYGMRALSKLMLNSLYGKYATSQDVMYKIPFLGDDEIVHYKFSEKERKDGLYIPIGSFITSYAREVTIRTSQDITNYSLEKYGVDMYVYSDTDSITTTLPIEEVEKFCKISDTKLGYWKHENTFKKAKFIRQKTYLKEIDDEIHITCAGMPKSCYSYVEWDSFKEGFSCEGKLRFSHLKGGVKLVPTLFTIKYDSELKNSLKRF